MCQIVIASIRCRKCQHELYTETRDDEGICASFRAMKGGYPSQCPRFLGERHIFERTGVCEQCLKKQEPAGTKKK